MCKKLINLTFLMALSLAFTTACGDSSISDDLPENDSNHLLEENNVSEEIQLSVDFFEPDSENQQIKINSNIALNKETITSENIRFNEGSVNVANLFLSNDNKTILIEFEEQIENGDYTLMISKNLESQNGSNLNQDYMYDFSVSIEELITGEGELYYKDGSLMFSGELVDSVPNGYGTHYEENGTQLAGTFKDGVLERCTRYKQDVLAYTEKNQLHILSAADILNKYFLIKFNAFAEEEEPPPPEPCVFIYLDDKLIYQGDYSTDENSAIGIIYNNDGNPIYFGETKDLLPHGLGAEYVQNGMYINTLYEGDFANGMYNGEGLLYVPESYNSNLSYFYGEWKDNMAHGEGSMTYIDKSDPSSTEKVIDSTFIDGEANGILITREQVLFPDDLIISTDINMDVDINIDGDDVINLAFELLPQTRAIRTIKKVVNLDQMINQ